LRAALIRHNTAIKKSYRDFAAWQCPAQDAFELSLRQFWTFATSAAIVTPELMTASLDRIVMRGTPPATHPLPPALELARQVASGGGPVYHRGGEHDGKRTLLLRDFVQGLVEIAAVRLRSGLVTVPGKEATSPVPALVHSLLELIERSILRKQAQGAAAEEGAGETADDADADGGEAALDVDSSSRLELVYAHYAITEPPPRWKRGNAEPTMTVRSYVRCLTDASLLPAESNVPALLSSTLPAYFFSMPPAPPAEAEVLALEGSPQEDFLAYPEGTIAEEGADFSEPPAQAEAEEAPEGAPAAAEGEGEEAGPKEPTPAEIAAQAEAEAEALERLEGTLTLELIYPEFEEAMLAFCRLHGPEAPWAPPPPPPEEVEGEEGEAGEAEVPANAKEAAAGDAGAEEEEEEAPAPAPAPEPEEPEPPPSPTATLRDVVLPAIGQHLLATHQQMASVAD